MKKILFLLHIPPPFHGSSVVGEYIFKSKEINNLFKCSYINLLTSKKVSESTNFSFNKIKHTIYNLYKLVFCLLNDKKDLCYYALTSSGFAFFRDLMYIIVLKLFNTSIVYHLHNKGFSYNSRSVVYNICYRFIFHNTKVILLSDSLYIDVKKYIKRNCVFICPNGIGSIKNEFINDMPIKDIQKPSLLFLSNLIKSKGVYDLIDACYILKKEGVSFICNFVGAEADINKEEINNRIQQLSLSSHVKYLGKMYDKSKHDIFIQSDIFVLPTYYANECFPLVLLEASQYSLSLVSTDEGAISEIIENDINGFIVEKKNPDDLAEKLKKLLSNTELRNKLSRAAHNKFINNYTLKIFTNNFINILNSILNEDNAKA